MEDNSILIFISIIITGLFVFKDILKCDISIKHYEKTAKKNYSCYYLLVRKSIFTHKYKS